MNSILYNVSEGEIWYSRHVTLWTVYCTMWDIHVLHYEQYTVHIVLHGQWNQNYTATQNQYKQL